MTDLLSKDIVATAIEAGESIAGVGPRLSTLGPEADPIHIGLMSGGASGTMPFVFEAAIKALDARAAGPRRRIGTFAFTEVDSLIEYVKRYSDASALIFADTSRLGFVVVFDDHPAGPAHTDAAWREHRATYACPKSPEWIAWGALDGVAQSQEKFADFVESRLEDIATGEGFPLATDVLAMARNLMIRTKGTFQKEFNPTSGDSVLVCKSETDAGSTAIPRAFLVGIPVFEGGERYRVEARVRFGFTDGKPAFSFSLHRRKEIERDAFAQVRSKIAIQTGVVVLAGSA